MVKAMAPKAPIGASRTTMWMTPKNTLHDSSRKPAALAALAQPSGEAEQDGDQQDLEDFALGEGAEEGVGNDVHQVIGALCASAWVA